MTTQELLASLPFEGLDTRNGLKRVAIFNVIEEDYATMQKQMHQTQGDMRWLLLIQALNADVPFDGSVGGFHRKFLLEDRKSLLEELPMCVIKAHDTSQPATIEFRYKEWRILVVYGMTPGVRGSSVEFQEVWVC